MNASLSDQHAPRATLVLYKTKYGSTKQYAQWIGEELKADVYEIGEVTNEMLHDCETVVIGGPVRMGVITCGKFLKNRWNILQHKHVILFSVSASPPHDPGIHAYYEKSVSPDIRSSIHYVPLWGKFGELDWIDRFLMFFPRHAVRMQLRKDPGNKELQKKYDGMTKQFDHLDRASIAPIVRYCREK